MVVSKMPGLQRSNVKHTDRIWIAAATPTDLSMLSPDDLLWLMEYWQRTLSLIHPFLPKRANSKTVPSDSQASDQTSIYKVRMQSNLAIETLCFAAEQRGLNSAMIRAANLVICKRLPHAAKWCFFDNGAGYLHRAEDFLCIRFPEKANPSVEERLDFKHGICELDRLRTKLEVESQSSLRLRIPREGTHAHAVIKVLFERGAFDTAHRMTAAQITDCAARCSDANNYKSSIATQRRVGFIDTKPGKDGGCWLTPTGRQIASDNFKR